MPGVLNLNWRLSGTIILLFTVLFLSRGRNGIVHRELSDEDGEGVYA